VAVAIRAVEGVICERNCIVAGLMVTSSRSTTTALMVSPTQLTWPLANASRAFVKMAFGTGPLLSDPVLAFVTVTVPPAVLVSSTIGAAPPDSGRSANQRLVPCSP
jgi:hypothetical protein